MDSAARKEPSSLPARIVAYIFVGVFCTVGPILLLFVAVTGVQRAWFVHSSLAANGEIVALRDARPYRSSNRRPVMPIFRFTAMDGRSYTVTSNVGERLSSWKLGGHVRVLYRPENPNDAHIDSFFQLWAFQAIVGTVGGAFSYIPLLIFIRRRRSMRDNG